MKKVIVTSGNPVKSIATKNAFQRMFPDQQFKIEAIAVSSLVKDQPASDEETLTGALNRVKNAKQIRSDANYWIGIEGGIEEREDGMVAFAWVFVENENGLIGKSRSGTFYLPDKVARKIREGIEMGSANDIIFDLKNSKQNSGAIGILTDDVIDRVQLYEHAIILALVAFKNDNLY